MKYMLPIVAACLFFVPAYAETKNAGLYTAGEMRSAEEGAAAIEFRRGVQAYYRSAYNDAVIQFAKALSYMNEDTLILDWLGKAYYHAGLEGTALDKWKIAAENGYGGGAGKYRHHQDV